MVVKTITVTKEAYDALKATKEPNESFSKTILRVARKRPLSSFFGVLSKESANRLEKAILESRKRYTKSHKERIDRIVKELEER